MAAREGVGGAGVVAHLVLEERADVAESGEADAQHRRVLRREDDLVHAIRGETAAHADLRRVRPYRGRDSLRLQRAQAQSALATSLSPLTTAFNGFVHA